MNSTIMGNIDTAITNAQGDLLTVFGAVIAVTAAIYAYRKIHNAISKS